MAPQKQPQLGCVSIKVILVFHMLVIWDFGPAVVLWQNSLSFSGTIPAADSLKIIIVCQMPSDGATKRGQCFFMASILLNMSAA